MSESRFSVRTRSRSSLSQCLEKNLTNYALIVSAAGVSLLALAEPAVAEVVYTPTNVSIGPGQSLPIDVNNDGSTDFLIGDNMVGAYVGLLTVRPIGSGSGAKSVLLGGGGVAALQRGVKIGPSKSFYGGHTSTYGDFMANANYSGATGPWARAKGRYMGLRFYMNGGFHYGWARMTVRVNDGHIILLLTGYAYETIANRSIQAGRTSGKAEASGRSQGALVPATNGASLGELACGASGRCEWRKPGGAN